MFFENRAPSGTHYKCLLQTELSRTRPKSGVIPNTGNTYRHDTWKSYFSKIENFQFSNFRYLSIIWCSVTFLMIVRSNLFEMFLYNVARNSLLLVAAGLQVGHLLLLEHPHESLEPGAVVAHPDFQWSLRTMSMPIHRLKKYHKQQHVSRIINFVFINL